MIPTLVKTGAVAQNVRALAYPLHADHGPSLVVLLRVPAALAFVQLYRQCSTLVIKYLSFSNGTVGYEDWEFFLC